MAVRSLILFCCLSPLSVSSKGISLNVMQDLDTDVTVLDRSKRQTEFAADTGTAINPEAETQLPEGQPAPSTGGPAVEEPPPPAAPAEEPPPPAAPAEEPPPVLKPLEPEGPSEFIPIYPFSSLTSSEEHMILEANCDFGVNFNLELCRWNTTPHVIERWISSKGRNAGWLGGPRYDNTNRDEEGGYALYETSRLVDNSLAQSLAFDSAMLLSPLLKRTEATGTCVSFWYAMQGLSQDRLRILLRPNSPRLEGKEDLLNITNRDVRDILLESDGRDDIVLWEIKDSTQGNWTNGQVVYAFNDKHLIIFEGIPVSVSDPNRAYRGYVTVDDIQLRNAIDCKPFCNFEGGFCSWTQDQSDDFDWTLSRGSLNPSTGPPMDRFSFNYGIKGGGFAYIDSGYPRRPFDLARLISEVFAPPGADTPLCLCFWAHMYGNGVGALRIILAPRNGEQEIIWELRGEQGNNWYQGQVTISSETDFQILIEGQVGSNSLGDIGIDEIALKNFACPTSPQSASKFSNDCTFEVDECGWVNVEFRERMDELDWERIRASAARAPSIDHTLKTSLGSFMTLPRNSVQRGERGWLMSSPIKPHKTAALCISFWYIMYDPFIEQTGPSLGSLTVLVMEQDQVLGLNTLTPIWSLRNHQGAMWQYGQAPILTKKNFVIIFEGLWGNSQGSEFMGIDDITFFVGNCRTLPEKATAHYLDCDFTRSPCSYTNTSDIGGERWVTASISRRPGTLPDHTYGGPVGYLYFDVFTPQSVRDIPRVSLVSRVIDRTITHDPICLTFWYAPIGNDADTILWVQRESADIALNDPTRNTDTLATSPIRLWRVLASDVYRDRIEWLFGQVQLDTSNDYRISIVGEALRGGFALDDVQVFPGTCQQRPEIISENTNFDSDRNRGGDVVVV